jgi:DNA-binding PadR family transcriptional regulator
MLSNIELILLGMVYEKPSYAYEIDKEIEAREMRRWVKIGVASVYQVLEKLAKKGMLESKREKEGKMPERRRYYLTKEGRKELARGAAQLLSELEWYFLDLNVGLVCSDILPREEVTRCLAERLRKVKANLSKMTRLHQNSDMFGASSKQGQIVLENLLLFRQAEKQFLERMMELGRRGVDDLKL